MRLWGKNLETYDQGSARTTVKPTWEYQIWSFNHIMFSNNSGYERRFDRKKLWNHEQFLYVTEWWLRWPTWGYASSSRSLAWLKPLRLHEGLLNCDWNQNLIQFNNRNPTRESLRSTNDKTVFTIFLSRTMRSLRRTFLANSPGRKAWERSRRVGGSWAPTSATHASSPVFLLTFHSPLPLPRDRQITAN